MEIFTKLVKFESMNVEKIRNDFPLLNRESRKKPYIYLDSACQSLRPRQVIEAINKYYLQLQACGGRSMHQLAAEVTRETDQARADIAKFLNAARKEEIVFTRNTTEGINLIAHSLDWKSGDEILISDKEHNSNLVPWQQLSKKIGTKLVILPSLPDNTFDFDGYLKLLNPHTKLVAFGHIANLDGVTIPAQKIIAAAHQNGSLVLLDAAQSAPHHPINVRALDVDFLAFSMHKMLGPSGMGILYGKYNLLEKLDPFLTGGDTVALTTFDSAEFLPPPEKFEAGLQDYAGIIGSGAAIRYLQNIGPNDIQNIESQLNQQLSDGIRDIPGLHIIGPVDATLRGGICTFYIDRLDSHRIALMLDQMANIQVRSGQHCVHSWFHKNQITGSVRASMYFYNTPQDVQSLVENLHKVIRIL